MLFTISATKIILSLYMCASNSLASQTLFSARVKKKGSGSRDYASKVVANVIVNQWNTRVTFSSSSLVLDTP